MVIFSVSGGFGLSSLTLGVIVYHPLAIYMDVIWMSECAIQGVVRPNYGVIRGESWIKCMRISWLRSAAINIRKQTIFLFAKLLLHRRVIDARRVRDDEASD